MTGCARFIGVVAFIVGCAPGQVATKAKVASLLTAPEQGYAAREYPDLEHGGARWLGKTLSDLRAAHDRPQWWSRTDPIPAVSKFDPRVSGEPMPTEGVRRVRYISLNDRERCGHSVEFQLNELGVIIHVDSLLIFCH